MNYIVEPHNPLREVIREPFALSLFANVCLPPRTLAIEEACGKVLGIHAEGRRDKLWNPERLSGTFREARGPTCPRRAGSCRCLFPQEVPSPAVASHWELGD